MAHIGESHHKGGFGKQDGPDPRHWLALSARCIDRSARYETSALALCTNLVSGANGASALQFERDTSRSGYRDAGRTVLAMLPVQRP